MGDYSKAIKYQIKNLNIALDIFGEDRWSAMFYAAIGDSYHLMDSLDIAEQYHLKALEMRLRLLGEEHLDLWMSYRPLGVISLNRGDFPKALEYFDKAARIALELKAERSKWLSPVYVSMIPTLIALGRSEEADSLLQATNKIIEEIYLDQDNYNDTKGYLYNITGQGAKAAPIYIEGMKKNLEEIHKNFGLMSERERENLYSARKIDNDVYYTFFVRHSIETPDVLGELYNLNLSTKSILLNTSNQIKRRILNSGDRVLIDLYDVVQVLKQEVGRLQQLSQEQAPATITLDSLKVVLDQKDKKLAEYSSLYSEGKKQHTWNDVQAVLGKNEAAVEIIRIRVYDFLRGYASDTVWYAALVITQKTKNHPELVLLNNGNDLEEKHIHFYRNSVRIQVIDNQSYQYFWEPIKKHLKGIKKVYFSPDGVFNLLNFETFYNPEKNKYLLDEIDVTRITSTKDLLAEERPPMPYNFSIILGNPDFGSDSSNTK